MCQSGRNCAKYGRIIFNHENRVNKDKRIIHLATNFWKMILNRHENLALRFDDVLDTIEDYDRVETVGLKKVRYFKEFGTKNPLEVMAQNTSRNKYHVFHVGDYKGKVVSVKKADIRC